MDIKNSLKKLVILMDRIKYGWEKELLEEIRYFIVINK